MRIALAIFALAAGLCINAFADETWQAALGRMPLGAETKELSRTNCIPLMLNAFQSNSVVKALVFMPGAADEFVFLRRANATLTNANPSLLDAVTALTNQTYIRADFRPPFLLLYTTEDELDPIAVVKSKSTAAKLQARTVPDRLVLCDSNWDDSRKAVARKVSISVLPVSNAVSSWHFWPNNFVACGVTQWELLEALALSGKTTFTLHWLTVDYELDKRSGPVENLKSFPGH
ncbi:MAG TPA: hypothetical protein VMH87_19185 [Pseudomonadales bacterium]|nr:hypothetical protein [Pseudomonadales bacterium]